MTVAAQLPRREVDTDRPLPDAAPAGFTTSSDTVDASQVAADMGDLAHRVRSLMALQNGHVAQLSLGGRFFDIVVTANGPDAFGAVRVLDSIQHSGRERADACGPVIEDTWRSWYIWLVPPGTSATWAPHRYALCLGRPYSLTLPAPTATEPPGPFWLRPCRGDRLVPAAALREQLDQFQPGPVPHETLLGSVLRGVTCPRSCAPTPVPRVRKSWATNTYITSSPRRSARPPYASARTGWRPHARSGIRTST